MQGKYSIATNGIKAEDVSTVQVMENHEHIKALQDQIPPESAAINLKAKRKKAKGRWLKTIDLGVGFDSNGLLREVNAALMYFAQRQQHVSITKQITSVQVSTGLSRTMESIILDPPTLLLLSCQALLLSVRACVTTNITSVSAISTN